MKIVNRAKAAADARLPPDSPIRRMIATGRSEGRVGLDAAQRGHELGLDALQRRGLDRRCLGRYLADSKRDIGTKDLLSLVGKFMDGSSFIELGKVSYQSNGEIKAHVELKVGEKNFEADSTGNGPVDAVYQCINRITGYEIRIDKYELKGKGEGKNALGQVDIVAEYKGRKFHGMGLATDIIESSAQALIHVINSIWRADQVAEQMERNVTKTDKINTESV